VADVWRSEAVAAVFCWDDFGSLLSARLLSPRIFEHALPCVPLLLLLLLLLFPSSPLLPDVDAPNSLPLPLPLLLSL
jgi:hypothetical protein